GAQHAGAQHAGAQHAGPMIRGPAIRFTGSEIKPRAHGRRDEHRDHAQRRVGGRLHRRREGRGRPAVRLVRQRRRPDRRGQLDEDLAGLGRVRPADVGQRQVDGDRPAPVRHHQRLGGDAADRRPRGGGVAPRQARRLAPRGVVLLRRRRGPGGGQGQGTRRGRRRGGGGRRRRRPGARARPGGRGGDGRRAGGLRRRQAVLRPGHWPAPARRRKPGDPGRPRAAPALPGQEPGLTPRLRDRQEISCISDRLGLPVPIWTRGATMTSRTAAPAGTSTSDQPYRPGWLKRFYDKLTGKAAVRHPWYTLPKALGLAELIGIRDTLRRENLYDTSRLPSVDPAKPPPYDESYLTARTADGSWTDLEHPEMGMAGTRFGRNVPLAHTRPDRDRMMVPNPREISRKLMTRDTFNPAVAGNALIAAWLQFMIHDWFKHGTSPKDNPWILPPVEGDDWPEPPLVVMRTPADPTSPPDSALPPTYLNVNTHWWDASSIYGDNLEQQRFLREGAGGRLRLDGGLPPVPPDPADNPALVPGFWLGLGMMQTLFAMEHNSIAAMLAAAHPES